MYNNIQMKEYLQKNDKKIKIKKSKGLKIKREKKRMRTNNDGRKNKKQNELQEKKIMEEGREKKENIHSISSVSTIHQENIGNVDKKLHIFKGGPSKIKSQSSLKIKKKKNQQNLSLSNLYFKFLEHNCDSAYNFNSLHFKEFLFKRHIQQSNSNITKIDLGFLSLSEIVDVVWKKNLLSQTLYKAFELESSHFIEKSFIAQLKNQNIRQVNYNKYCFLPIDHRMISFVLKKLYPKQFTNAHKPLSFEKQITLFYEFIYSLSEKKYWQIYEKFNKKHTRNWVPDYEQIQNFIQNSKENSKENKQENNSREDKLLFIRYDRILRKK